MKELSASAESTQKSSYIQEIEHSLRDFLPNQPQPQPQLKPETPEPISQISFSDEELSDLCLERTPKVKIYGIGGAGGNSIARLLNSGVNGAETLILNTDAQHLRVTPADRKILLGLETCKGFGAGNNPEIGEKAARESEARLRNELTTDLAFVTCGLGGGTGTGAAPVIARAAKDMGALTISVCTLPFRMEGQFRHESARKGLQRLYEASDTVVVIPNEKLLELSTDITVKAAFKIADEVLVRAVSTVVDLIVKPQLINFDFSDVRRVLSNGGVAMISMGESESQSSKVEEAVEEALKNPLLNDLDISTANKALICISGGEELGLNDAQRAVYLIEREIDPKAEVIWGASLDSDLPPATFRVIVVLSNCSSPFTHGNSDDSSSNSGSSSWDSNPQPPKLRMNSLLRSNQVVNESKEMKKKKKRFWVF